MTHLTSERIELGKNVMKNKQAKSVWGMFVLLAGVALGCSSGSDAGKDPPKPPVIDQIVGAEAVKLAPDSTKEQNRVRHAMIDKGLDDGTIEEQASPPAKTPYKIKRKRRITEEGKGPRIEEYWEDLDPVKEWP